MWTYTHDFLKKVELDLKMWTFTHDFLKKVDLNLKIVDLNAWGSAERGPQQNMDLYAWFLKKGDLDLRNVDLYSVIFLNKNYLYLRNGVIYT